MNELYEKYGNHPFYGRRILRVNSPVRWKSKRYLHHLCANYKVMDKTVNWLPMCHHYILVPPNKPVSAALIKKVKITNVALAGMSGATLFFITSNFLVWAQGGGYGLGFIGTYAAAIPFYLNSILGNLAWSTILFGLYALSKNALKQTSFLYTKD